jgi:hypothetical protein
VHERKERKEEDVADVVPATDELLLQFSKVARILPPNGSFVEVRVFYETAFLFCEIF